MLSLEPLLPLRSVVATLRFDRSSAPAFFHQPALGAFLRHLAGGSEGFERLLRFDAPESGRIAYAPGQYYRFHLIGLNGSETLLRGLLSKLARLPAASPKNDPRLPFRDNWTLVALHDAFSARPIQAFEELSVYDEASLARETEFWRARETWTWRFLAPARLLKDKARRGEAKGEARYCRNLADVDGALLAARLHDSLAESLKNRGAPASPRPPAPKLEIADGHLFWLDAAYTDAEGKEHVMGGMNGRLRLRFPEPPPESWLRQAVLGQYIGLGQRVAFGFGRYRLETPDGEFSLPRPLPAASLLMLAREEDNLIEAWRHIAANRSGARAEDEWTDAESWEEEDAAERAAADEEVPVERLQAALDRALAGDYRPPPLRGLVLPKPGGGSRPLAVPPFFDRALQRAVAQILTPALEAAQYRHSYGYRLGRSRQGARDAVQAASREGYSWVYESDVQDFFDSVAFERLGVRLSALYGEDPAVRLILDWMRRPVEWRGRLIERELGLPQGSPLSPLMANLMLDDFDCSASPENPPRCPRAWTG
jgi:hypothetical protein